MTPTQSELAEVGSARPWPAERIELWPIERLIPYANNARTHSEADIDRISASILSWGWTAPVVCDEEGNIIAGHARALAARQLGLPQIPVAIARGWTDEEKRA